MFTFKSALVAAVMLFLSSPGTSAGPDIQVSPTEYDLGDIEEGVIASHEFKIENLGDAPLNISRVKTSCGCTASKLSKNTLAPGESTMLKVEYDSEGRPGRFEKKITIFSDDPDENKKDIYLTGFVKMRPGPKINVEPSVLRINTVEGGQEIPISFTIENVGEMDLAVNSIALMTLNDQNQPDNRKTVLKNPFTLKPGDSHVFGAKITSPPSGFFRFVYMVMSNDPHVPVSYVRVVGRVDENAQ